MAPPEPPSPITSGDIGNAEAQLRLGRAGDGLGLAALFRLDARIGAGGVDEGDHRQPEAVGHLHQAHGLAIALGPGHAEIVPDAGLGVVALFLAHDADGLAAEAPEAADDGLVLGELAVAGERREFGDEAGAVIDEMRPLGMARDEGLLPGRELGIELLEGVGGLDLQARDVVGDGDGVPVLTERPKLLDLGFKLGDGLFEIEITAHQTL